MSAGDIVLIKMRSSDGNKGTVYSTQMVTSTDGTLSGVTIKPGELINDTSWGQTITGSGPCSVSCQFVIYSATTGARTIDLSLQMSQSLTTMASIESIKTAQADAFEKLSDILEKQTNSTSIPTVLEPDEFGSSTPYKGLARVLVGSSKIALTDSTRLVFADENKNGIAVFQLNENVTLPLGNNLYVNSPAFWKDMNNNLYLDATVLAQYGAVAKYVQLSWIDVYYPISELNPTVDSTFEITNVSDNATADDSNTPHVIEKNEEADNEYNITLNSPKLSVNFVYDSIKTSDTAGQNNAIDGMFYIIETTTKDKEGNNVTTISYEACKPGETGSIYQPYMTMETNGSIRYQYSDSSVDLGKKGSTFTQKITCVRIERYPGTNIRYEVKSATITLNFTINVGRE